MKRIALIAGFVFAAVVGVAVVRALTGAAGPQAVEGGIDVAVPEAQALSRFAQAIRFETISHSPGSGVALDEAAFGAFHAFLRASYPLVHAELSLETVADYTLLFTWKGSDASLQPVLVMGHFDVVPAASDAWTYPPFAGQIADGYLWGRGAIDDKINVVGLLEAAELLLARGFEPARTVYLAFGHDEKIGGEGAQSVAGLLRERGVRPMLVVDEGGAVATGMLPGLTTPVAAVGVAEKGSVSLKLTFETDGGHSSVPPTHTAAGVIATAIHRLERNQMPGHFDHLGRTLTGVAPHMSFGYRLVLQNQWLFGPLLETALVRIQRTAPMLRTTTAATIFHAGVKENVLPSFASATVNFRIFPGDTIDGVVAHVRRVVDDDRIRIEPTEKRREPSNVSQLDTPAWTLLTHTIRQTYGDVAVTPMLIPGGTDARYFRDLSEGVFGFMPVRLATDDFRRAHGIDERIPTASFLEGIRFYAQLLTNAGVGVPGRVAGD